MAKQSDTQVFKKRITAAYDAAIDAMLVVYPLPVIAEFRSLARHAFQITEGLPAVSTHPAFQNHLNRASTLVHELISELEPVAVMAGVDVSAVAVKARRAERDGRRRRTGRSRTRRRGRVLTPPPTTRR